ncbi:MAG: pentapeptide repeat-containing protein [Armatimonadota bacterium]
MEHRDVEYMNGRDRCPAALWPDDEADDTRRCQHAFSKYARCGLPAFADTSEGPRCLFHSTGERDPDLVRTQLEAMVQCHARLWDADLQYADLLGAKLSGAELMDANLRGARLVDADLSHADLSDADLTDVDLRFSDLRHADLTDADLEGAPDLRQANLTDAKLTGVQISPQCKLAHTTWDEDSNTIREEREALQAMKEGNHRRAHDLFNIAAMVYRQIKQAYQDGGDHQTGGNVFIREMECRRAQLRIHTRDHPRGRVWERALWWLMHHICGYGEWPGRLALTGAIMVVAFAIIHGYFCGFNDGVVRGIQVGPGIDWIPSAAGVLNFIAALYFSVVTFTGLGYGDIHPINAPGRMVASAEVVLGFVTLSLLLVTIVRKWSR